MSKPILLFSGGLDSTTLLWKMKPEVKCISFDYGQRHDRELQSAIDICRQLEIEHKVVSLGRLHEDRNFYYETCSVSELIEMGSQTGYEPVPHGHYAAESMKKTVVPNRNMIMLAIATGWAVASGSPFVCWAAHAGDHAIYPDCRPEFFNAMSQAIVLGNEWTPVHLKAPFIHLTKAQVVNQGKALGVPFELTYSCYEGRELHCGKCGTCVERKEAFALNGFEDPTQYA